MDQSVVGAVAALKSRTRHLKGPLSQATVEAARDMFDQHGKELRGFAILVLQAQPDDADDLVQKAILTYMGELEQRAEPIANPLPWIRQVMRRDRIDDLKRDRRRQEILLAKGPGTARMASTGEDALNLWENAQAVNALLEMLTPAQRDAMACAVDEMEPAEIALFLGKTPATIRQHLMNARERLKKVVPYDPTTSKAKERSQ